METTMPDGRCQGTNPRYCGAGRQRRAHAPGDPSGVNTGGIVKSYFRLSSTAPCALCYVHTTFDGHNSALRDLVFCEERLDPLEGLVDRLGRRHAVVDDIEHRHAPDMLGINLRNGRVEEVVKWYGRVDQALFGIAWKVRVLGVLPERILDEFWHGRQPPAQPRLDELADHLRLNPVFQELLGHCDVLRSFGDHGAADTECPRHS